MKIKSQYYRDNKQYLIRFYCTDCNSEMVYVGQANDKYEYECKGCDGKEITTVKYPYWYKNKFGIKLK